MGVKPVKAVLGLAAVAFAAAYLGSPFWAAHQLTEAVKRRDADAIGRRVDFPAFRASLKEEASARLLARVEAETGLGDELSGFGRMLVPSVISGLVDVAITPDVIAAIIETGEAPGVDALARRRSAREEKTARDGGTRQSWTYRGLNLFAVTISRERAPEERLALLLERRGLFDWKLAGIDLDPGADGP